jgi:hypothetical protein
MYGVHNKLHSGMICSRSIGHVSVLNLNMRNYLDMGTLSTKETQHASQTNLNENLAPPIINNFYLR